MCYFDVDAQEFRPNHTMEMARSAFQHGDAKLAIKLFTEEAKRGNGYAELSLGEIYDKFPLPIHNTNKAMFWFVKAWQRGGEVGQIAAGRIEDVGASSGHTRKEMREMLALGELARMLPKGNYEPDSEEKSWNEFYARRRLDAIRQRSND